MLPSVTGTRFLPMKFPQFKTSSFSAVMPCPKAVAAAAISPPFAAI